MSTSTDLEELKLQAPPETMVLYIHKLLPFIPPSGETVPPSLSGEASAILPAPKLHSLELSFCPNIDDHTRVDLQLKILANITRMVHDTRGDWIRANNPGASQEGAGLRSILVPSCLFSPGSALAGLEALGSSYLCNCPDQ